MSLQLAEAFITINVPTGPVATAMSNIKNVVNQNVNQISGGFTQIINNISKVSGASAGAAGSMLSLSDSLARMVVGFVSAQAAIRALLGSFQEALALDNNLTQAQAVLTNATEEQRTAMRNLALTLSTETGQSASSLAEAFRVLAKAGFTVEDQLKLLPIAAKFAVATNNDLIKSTEALVEVQSSLGLRIRGMSDATQQAALNLQNLQHVSDLLAKASTAGQASVQDLAEALNNKAAAAMQKYGLSIEDTIAALVAFGNVGITGQRAGTAFDQVVRVMVNNAIRLKSTFERLNIEPFDKQTGQLKDFASILTNIDKIFEQLSDETRAGLLLDLFPQRGGAGFLTVLAQAGPATKALVEGLKQVAGVSEGIFAKAMQSNQKQLDAIQRQFEALGVGITDKLIKAFVVLVKPIAFLADVLGRIDRAMGGFLSTVLALVGGFEVATKVLPLLGGLLVRLGFGKVALEALKLFDALGVIGPLVRTVTNDFHDLLKSIPGVGGLLSAIFKPATFLLDALATGISTALGFSIGAALKDAFFAAIEHLLTPNLTKAINEAVPKFIEFATQVGRIFAELGKSIVISLAQIGGKLLGKLGFPTEAEVADSLEGVVKAIGNLAGRIAIVLKVVVDNWEITWRLIENIVKTAMLEIKDLAERMVVDFQGAMFKLHDILLPIWEFILQDMLIALAKFMLKAGGLLAKLAIGPLGDLLEGPLNKATDAATAVIAEQVRGREEIQKNLPEFRDIPQRSRDELLAKLAAMPEKEREKSTMAAFIENELSRRGLAGERQADIQKLQNLTAQALAKQAETPTAATAQAKAAQEKLNVPITKNEIPFFTKFEDFSKQLQEALLKDDKLGAVVTGLAEASQGIQQVVGQTKRTADLLEGHKDGGAPPAGPGSQTATTGGPRVGTRAAQHVPMRGPTGQEGQRVIRRGEIR